MKTEYRLAIHKHGQISYSPKYDLEHAEKGLADSIRDFERYSEELSQDFDAWVETRKVEEWGKTLDNCTET